MTWNEVAFVAFLFVLVSSSQYLGKAGEIIGDLLWGFRSAGRRDSEPK